MTTEKQYIHLDDLKQYLIMEEGGDKIYWNGGVFWAMTFKDEFKPKETGKKDTDATGGDSSSEEVETSSMSHSKIRPLSERIHYFTVDEKKNNKKKNKNNNNNNNGNDNAFNIGDILKQIRADSERERAEWKAERERERARNEREKATS